MANVTVEGLTDLEKELKNISATETRRAIRKALTRSRRVAVNAIKAASPSGRVRAATRAGSTILFKARRGGVTFTGDRGNLGFTAVGVPSPRAKHPNSNRRAWFVAYSLEHGNPGESSRAQSRRRYKRSQIADPFMAQAVEGSFDQIVNTFGDVFKQELKL